MIALLLAMALNAQAKGKGFKDVVKHLETNYRARKTRIPMLGLANFAVKLIRPAGVKGLQTGCLRESGLLSARGRDPFDSVMRECLRQRLAAAGSGYFEARRP